jgi:FKBP-type peptidyl-prolyl cis-trans isomerase FkpA
MISKSNYLHFPICILIFSILTFSFSCGDGQQKSTKMTKEDLAKYDKSLQAANRYLTKLDAERIENYAKRRNWDMKVTKSGLWYQVYEQGTGNQATPGKIAVLNYKISLLDGTLCYSSDSLGSKEFSIGHGGVESGLEEGILLLRVGDKARFIMPPYRAHGLLGDMKKIPARSIIVYDLELLKLIDE